MKSFSTVAQLAKGLIQTSFGVSIALIAAPAFANNASVSGAVSYTTPAGYSTSISAEKVAPRGYNFTGNVTITVMPGAPGGAPIGMILGGGDLTPTVAGPAVTTANMSLKDKVISTLNGLDVKNQAELESYTAIVKAAAGANGLE